MRQTFWSILVAICAVVLAFVMLPPAGLIFLLWGNIHGGSVVTIAAALVADVAMVAVVVRICFGFVGFMRPEKDVGGDR